MLDLNVVFQQCISLAESIKHPALRECCVLLVSEKLSRTL